MALKKFGVSVPDIGCTIREIQPTSGQPNNQPPKFEIEPNDADAYDRLMKLVEADVSNDLKR